MSDIEDRYIKEYSKLVGKTVERIVKSGQTRDCYYGLEFTDNTIAWIACDPEGNGPGFLDIRTVITTGAPI